MSHHLTHPPRITNEGVKSGAPNGLPMTDTEKYHYQPDEDTAGREPIQRTDTPAPLSPEELDALESVAKEFEDEAAMAAWNDNTQGAEDARYRASIVRKAAGAARLAGEGARDSERLDWLEAKRYEALPAEWSGYEEGDPRANHWFLHDDDGQPVGPGRDTLRATIDAARAQAAGASPRCTHCNDEGVVCTHEGEVIGPCECARGDAAPSVTDEAMDRAILGEVARVLDGFSPEIDNWGPVASVPEMIAAVRRAASRSLNPTAPDGEDAAALRQCATLLDEYGERLSGGSAVMVGRRADFLRSLASRLTPTGLREENDEPSVMGAGAGMPPMPPMSTQADLTSAKREHFARIAHEAKAIRDGWDEVLDYAKEQAEFTVSVEASPDERYHAEHILALIGQLRTTPAGRVQE